ncbi:5-formyltetrahydrofolate cyclo-ligase [Aquimarina brevivitae]|uniref:5-formyltetrahydrofolate cyclo-ligase n=1 Tax=Aquimarina brevivitae TaxID=323412 RepID=A0A4Q7PGY9_9FLAO|nr:5-formyltetrahydrofolate cyclo-ligase [Aquimarina brevivitae]RZS99407.1 5-formyltetrahydrofolate cyclo-ligase [Aquimarina brevivitae]
MSKTALRKKYKALRASLSDEEIDDKSIAIANHLITLNIWHHEFYHLFLAIKKLKEVETEYVLNILLGKDKNVVLSKSNFQDASLTHYLLTDTTKIKVNSFGIPEPEAGIPIEAKMLDVVFIPLLAFDKKGNRIGYGKGFYDRFLAQCKEDVIKIGLSFFEPEDHIADLSTTDIPLDYCITPQQVYSFSS